MKALVLVAVLASVLAGVAVGAGDREDSFSVESLTRLVITNDRQSRYNREWACWMLAGTELPPTAALPALIVAMQDGSPANESARAACARAIAMLGPSAAPAVDALVGVLDEDALSLQWRDTHDARENGRTVGEVVKALGQIGPAAIPALVRRLDFRPDDQGENTNAALAPAASALGRIGLPAVPALLEALKDPEKKYGAIDALGDVGASAADRSVPALIPLARDPDSIVRGGVVSALGHMGPRAQDAVPALVDALNDESDSVRLNAIWALAGIGAGAQAAVPALTRLAESGKGHFEAAQLALKKIQDR